MWGDTIAKPTESDPAPACATSLYYLHPLLAGAIGEWERHFARAAELGFDGVVLGPCAQPGRAGNLFAVAEHDRLHPMLGGGDALKALDETARRARRHGLSVSLDLVLDRMAADSELVRAYPEWFEPIDEGRGVRRFRYGVGSGAVVEWWAAQLDRWLATGLAGFRCEAAHHVPPFVWSRLIQEMRPRYPGTLFLAWTHGAGPAAIAGLSCCGFDFCASSSCWWDFRAGWIDEDADRVGAVGAVMALPEPLYGPRAASQGKDAGEAGQASRRALTLAAHYGAGWLMPMGFEYGATAALEPADGHPEVFGATEAAARDDLRHRIVAANARRRRERARFAGPPARLVSAPESQVAVLARREGLDPWMVLACNPSLDVKRCLAVSEVLPGLGGNGGALAAEETENVAPIQAGQVMKLDAGEASVFRFVPQPPIQREPELRLVPNMPLAPRIAINAVEPEVEAGRYPAKGIVGETVQVEATIIMDGHARLAAELLWRSADQNAWRRSEMAPIGNDRWASALPLERVGRYLFTIEAWYDEFASLTEDIEKKRAADQSITLELQEAAAIVSAAASRGDAVLSTIADRISVDAPERSAALLTEDDTARAMRAKGERKFLTQLNPARAIDAERPKAAFASWYELFPRSQSGDPSRHGTFTDVIARLPAIRAMGFDVLYFPPIHPIGKVHRKGRNNALVAGPQDLGSPYAIGSDEGGHQAVHPELGTLEDFRRLLAVAADAGIEIALDFAIQCAPDHPWVRSHPEWFAWRPDGSLRYSENPPKRYEDIVNVDFYASGAVPSLWFALRDVVLFWLGQGVRIFRVDNPHTKPLPFWEWLIEDVRARAPDVIFLAEAFTRPAMMYQLAKVGFSESYTYFTWRNSKYELQQYFTELSGETLSNFFRPHLFVNTPDINPFFLQSSGRAGFLIRAALAATLSGLWGLYNGFELCEARVLPGREEYLDSEKYQLRVWDWGRPGNIIAEITALNRIRRANPALHSHRGLSFLNAWNDQILYFLRSSPDQRNRLLVAINLDPHHVQEAEVEIPLWLFGLGDDAAIAAEDLMANARLVWRGKRQRIRLDPGDLPFAIWRLSLPLPAKS